MSTLSNLPTFVRVAARQVSASALFCLLLALCLPASAADIYVSPLGSDKGSGAPAQPVATLHAALRRARELRRLGDPSVENGVRIVVAGGTYRLTEPVMIRPEDSGTENSPTIIEAAAGEAPVLSGGLPVGAWQKAGAVAGLPAAAQGKVWVAEAPKAGGRGFTFRQLWVNEQKAVRAQHAEADSLPRILSWDAKQEECRIPAPAGRWGDVGAMEMLILQRWAVAVLRVKALQVKDGAARVTFHEPESRIQLEHPWPSPVVSERGNSAFALCNAVEFLDKPGEWFLDEKAGKLLYYPRAGEDMRTATAVAPLLETLVQVEGSADRPVEHVYISGIGFAHSTWLRPSLQGHVPLQAGMYLRDAYKLPQPGLPWDAQLENQAWVGRQPAAVAVSGARNIRFARCTFAQLAATGLDFTWGASHSRVERCTFSDVGGSAIVGGAFQEGGVETHVPYDPADKRALCHHLRLYGNRIANAASEDWGCVGISIGYAHDVAIERNELSDLPYSGICVGWGWTKRVSCMRNNRIAGNHVHHFAKRLFAAGGLYTLSAQPGTTICGNYVHDMVRSPYMQEPEYCYYIYLDGASSYIAVHDNFCPEATFGENNPGPGNTWRDNGPTAADSLRSAAGLPSASEQHQPY
ncbi:MAG: right-handed parallel beta-helix repeat-containing protein [Prevotellaceae bacterium]|jgi:hypothetical protein|nr:right-handed parallel beta-helix repeat-containing protein [Prevotellaceae bacterium]